MTQGNRTNVWFAAALAMALAACSSSSSSNEASSVRSVTQDLTVDPDGNTIVVRFDENPGSVSASNFSLESGSQSILTVSKSGKAVTITWDDRVTPTHRLLVENVGTVLEDFLSIVTTDDDAPTFTVGAGTQDAAELGGDSFDVTFDGPRVVPEQAEDPDNWTLTVDGQELDLSGSTLSLDEDTQILSFTLGSQANLHATFSLAAAAVSSVADVELSSSAVSSTAAGDTTAPTLVSIEQNLADDELGRVIDYTFSEPMDPVFSARPVNFAIDDHDDSSSTTTATGISQPSDEVIRVTYSSPVVPGLDQVALSGIVDAHGNAFASGTFAIANSSPAANGYESVSATTAEGEGGDTIVVVTDQAFDPDLAVDPDYWTLNVGGSNITMDDQELTYDLEERELTIALDFDMQNGDAVLITAVALPDIDGQAFNAADNSATAAGDDVEPSVLTVTQNRGFDPTGVTLDVRVSEDLDETAAETIANWTLSGGLTVTAAELLGSLSTVRLTADDVVVPGDFTLTAEAGLEDLAGNATGAAQAAIAIVSTDTSEPSLSSVSAEAVEGADDDLIVITFDDDMVQSEVEDDANWTIESPTGTSLDITGCTLSYDTGSRQLTITLDAGDLALKAGDDVLVEAATMRDIADNTISADTVEADVEFETNRPSAHLAWYDTADVDQITILFSEPCDQLDDLYDAGSNTTGTRYALRIGDGGANDGLLRGYPIAATPLYGGLGVLLEYGFAVNSTDTVDVLGATDLAGNYMFPQLAMVTVAEDSDTPALDGSSTIAVVSGERNDVVTVTFTEDMSPWSITSTDNYTLQTSAGSVEQDLSGASIEFDGSQTVTITLGQGSNLNLLDSTDYDVLVNVAASNPLRTAQGLALGAQDTDASITASGDAVAPTVGVNDARFHATDDDTILVIFDEAVDEELFDAADFTYNGVAADSVSLISPRVAELVFGASLVGGFSVDIQTASISDLAGNVPGAVITVAVTSDATAPIISSVSATAVSGAGGDTIEIDYNEEVDPDTALDVDNYALTQGGNVVSLSGATVTYDSTTSTVTLTLPVGSELDYSAGWTLTVSDVEDVVGNPLAAPVGVSGAVAGDGTAPSIVSSFVNLREDESGTTIDVLFSEDVDVSYISDYANWSTDGAASVSAATLIDARHVRLTLDTAMASSDVLQITAVEDMAANASGNLTSDPQE